MVSRVLLQRTIITVSIALQTLASASAVVGGPTELVYRSSPRYDGGTDTLHVRVWEPNDDRPHPLIVWIHGGAFYAGSYRAMDTLCKRWSERGYIAASIQYRLGFHSPFPLDPPYAYDRAEVVRACWRGVQDVREGIRFILSRNDHWLVDTTCIVLAGESAGAIIALQTLIADRTDSVPEEVLERSDVVRGSERWTRPALGPIDDAGASPLPRVAVALNRFGAVMHPHMLQADDIPALFSYHQRGDLIVACGVAKGLWGLPLGVGDNFPTLWGSCAIESLLRDAGHPVALRDTWFVDGLGHETHIPWEVAAREYAFVDKHGCAGPVSVPAYPASILPQAWTAYDVLGRILASGFGTDREAVDNVSEVHRGPCIIVFADGTVHTFYVGGAPSSQ